MTLLVDLPPALEAEVRARAAAGDRAGVRALLLRPEAFEALVDASISTPTFAAEPSSLDAFFEGFVVRDPSVRPLSDHAVSRAGLYEDHP